MAEPWTILELAELAADALAVPAPAGSGAGPSGAGASRSGPARMNGRVRDVPNERLVRWYVTVGLVDPPLSRRGRVARYGRRHLLQLVAVKRRQAEGRSLAEIQAELAGATDEALAAVARVPDTLPAPEAPVAAPGRFWVPPPPRRPAGPGGPGGSRRRHSPGRARARAQARARGDAVAGGRGPRAGPGRRDGNPECRAAAAGGAGPPAAMRRSTRNRNRGEPDMTTDIALLDAEHAGRAGSGPGRARDQPGQPAAGCRRRPRRHRRHVRQRGADAGLP